MLQQADNVMVFKVNEVDDILSFLSGDPDVMGILTAGTRGVGWCPPHHEITHWKWEGDTVCPAQGCSSIHRPVRCCFDLTVVTHNFKHILAKTSDKRLEWRKYQSCLGCTATSKGCHSKSSTAELFWPTKGTCQSVYTQLLV